MTDFDALVVGGGPAGSTAARELAASGARVLVVDREAFPRYKACGGGIPLRTERLLPFPIDSVVEDAVSLLEVSYQGRWRFRKDSGRPFAHMVMRDRFDALLLAQAERAGAQFRGGSPVRALHDGPDGLAIETADGFRASGRYLVCADGAHSPVGRMAGLGTDLAEVAAWEVEVRGGPAATRYRGRALIDLGYRPWGYAWLFPKADVLSFGVVVPPGQASTMKGHVRRFIDRLGFGGAEVAIARGHKVRLRRGGERIAAGRVLLAGDAAGLADEFTEEGISYAVESGRLAARNVLRALGGDGCLDRYATDIDREILPELKGARLIAHMFYGMLGRAPRPWLFAASHTPMLWDAFFAVQKGESTYAREVARFPWLARIAARQLGMQWP